MCDWSCFSSFLVTLVCIECINASSDPRSRFGVIEHITSRAVIYKVRFQRSQSWVDPSWDFRTHGDLSLCAGVETLSASKGPVASVTQAVQDARSREPRNWQEPGNKAIARLICKLLLLYVCAYIYIHCIYVRIYYNYIHTYYIHAYINMYVYNCIYIYIHTHVCAILFALRMYMCA